MLALATAATALSGCMYLSPDQTTKSYLAADGVDVTVGSLQVQNALIVTTGKGAAGHMQGLAVNNGDTAINLTVSGVGSTRQITIPASTAVRLDGKANGDSTNTISPAVSVSAVASDPGLSQKVTFSTTAAGQKSIQVPIVLDQYPYGTASDAHPTYSPPAGATSGNHE